MELASRMNSLQFATRGGAESLSYGPADVPRPGEEEIMVRVRASAVTPTELTWYPTWNTKTGEPRPFPIIPGHEFSGVVHSLGEGVIGVSPGDAVFGMSDWFSNGAQAEYCLTRPEYVCARPASIDDTTAAVVPISALTAWQGLIERAKLVRGERVLVHGAAGSVGLFAVQIARWVGARVIATASARNLDFVRGLGAERVIEYHTERFEQVVRDADVVFDTVGGETLAKSWATLRSGGRMVTITAVEGQTQDQRVKDAFFIVEPSGSQLSKIAGMIDAGHLRAVVDSVFALAAGRMAYERKPTRGKVVVTIA